MVAASVVVERAADLLALLGLAFIAVLAAQTADTRLLLAACGLVAFIVVLVRVTPAVVARLPAATPPAIRRVAEGFNYGLARVGLRPIAQAYVLSAVAWLGDVLLFWACGMALGYDLRAALVIALAVGAAIGTALPAAGYVGTYELGAVLFASIAGLVGEDALALVAGHVLAVVPVGMFGVVAMLTMGTSLDDVRARQPALLVGPDG